MPVTAVLLEQDGESIFRHQNVTSKLRNRRSCFARMVYPIVMFSRSSAASA